jgi:hypothetical protein
MGGGSTMTTVVVWSPLTGRSEQVFANGRAALAYLAPHVAWSPSQARGFGPSVDTTAGHESPNHVGIDAI